jgi:hypothetical protein
MVKKGGDTYRFKGRERLKGDDLRGEGFSCYYLSFNEAMITMKRIIAGDMNSGLN